MYACSYNTLLGKIHIHADDKSITGLSFGESRGGSQIKETALIKEAYLQLNQYLEGGRKHFDLPLSPKGTEFQQKVYKSLSDIPYGRTRSYKDIAKAVGNEKACRAVGMANNKNPIPVFIPCHRVIGVDGSLTGYGGGLEIKEKLLETEKNNSRYFEFGQKELSYLKSRDKLLGRVIDSVQKPEYEVIPDLFAALVYNIVGQQISMKAAGTVWQRFLSRFGEITPQLIASLSAQELQSAGISMRKAQYIKSAADKVVNGGLDIERLKLMPDDAFCAELLKLGGVGLWTAEMLMIFSLERKDVLSFRDLGIRQGICRLYGVKTLTPERFEQLRRQYSPFGTVASFYLWSVNSQTP